MDILRQTNWTELASFVLVIGFVLAVLRRIVRLSRLTVEIDKLNRRVQELEARLNRQNKALEKVDFLSKVLLGKVKIQGEDNAE